MDNPRDDKGGVSKAAIAGVVGVVGAVGVGLLYAAYKKDISKKKQDKKELKARLKKASKKNPKGLSGGKALEKPKEKTSAEAPKVEAVKEGAKEGAKEENHTDGAVGEAEAEQAQPVSKVEVAKKVEVEDVTEEKREEKRAVAPASASEGGRLSKQVLIEVFEDTLIGMESTIHEMHNMHMALRQDEGSNLSEQEMMQVLSTKYEQAMSEVQAKAMAKYNTTERAIDEAAARHEQDPDFIKIMQKLERLNRALSGEPMPMASQEQLARVPSDLTLDKVIELFTEMTDKMMAAKNAVITEVMTETNGVEDQALIATRYTTKATQIKDELLKSYGIEEEILDLAMQKYMPEPKLQQAMMEMQKKQMASDMERQQQLQALRK